MGAKQIRAQEIDVPEWENDKDEETVQSSDADAEEEGLLEQIKQQLANQQDEQLPTGQFAMHRYYQVCEQFPCLWLASSSHTC